ncbi:AAA family ATPase [Hoeflea sp.]|uniref:ATP-binding protein n=1 Tax=Hoeflea sp. TaxID=1940281 RepID=UPI003B01AC2E
MARKRLPIGIQSFARLRETDSYYVDKTPLIRNLIDHGDYWFLSRPRRFGKSLLVDTIKALFEGQETLFEGLDIHPYWDWSAPHPVLRLSFDGKYSAPEEIEGDIIEQLEAMERRYNLSPAMTSDTGPRRLRNLLDRLHDTTGRHVVILVDEYDKPILDTLGDPTLATANRDYLRGFYGIIKGSAAHVRFVFVTGISMFSKVSLFSGLNNLEDISLDPRFATLCGYTGTDIDTVFAPELDGLDREEIRRWYNGYNWGGDTRVYNPFDVLLLFRKREFRAFWFETGSPNFLFETLKAKSISPMELEGRFSDMSLISKFDVNDISPEALLFQTGYLTITDEQKEGYRTSYRLDYPNLEVKLSLNDELLAHLDERDRIPLAEGRSLRALLEANDFKGFGEQLRAWLASIPYQWHATGDLARYEAWYASLLHMCFRAIGVEVHAEDISSHGRADLVVRLGEQVFILEFKMADSIDDVEAKLDAALAQIRDRGYADKYRQGAQSIHLIGIACGREARNLLEIRAEPADTQSDGDSQIS